MYGLPAPCAATVSIDSVAYEESPMQSLYLAAARETAASPSGWANLCMAAGAKPNGKFVLIPKISVERSILSTLTRIRGLILYRSNAASLSRRLFPGE